MAADADVAGCGEPVGCVHTDRFSRRKLLTGAAAGGGLLATLRIGTALGASSMSNLDGSAEALETAFRLDPPEFEPAPSTTVPAPTTTTTVPGSGGTVPPLADGEILFPLLLENDATCFVLDNFGDTRGRCCGYYHQGVDIMAPENTPQLACADGVLTKWYHNSFFGWTLTGDDGVTYKYFHNTAEQNGWSEGDRVQVGDVIGFVGDTGTSAGNFHLHFEYRPSNVPADPINMLQRVPGATFQ